MLNINTVKQHIDAGHEFYWEALPFTHRYQLRAVTYSWINGNYRSKNIYTAPDYETAKLVCETVKNLRGTISTESLDKIADERWLETGSK